MKHSRAASFAKKATLIGSIGFAFAAFGEAPLVAAPTPATVNATVTNTAANPVPVGVQGTVAVVNPANDPLVVREIGQPLHRKTWQKANTITICPGDRIGWGPLVWAGANEKIVIENIYASFDAGDYASTDNPISGHVLAYNFGELDPVRVPLNFHALDYKVNGSPRRIVSQQVTATVEPQGYYQVEIDLMNSNPTTNICLSIVVSLVGHTELVPSP